jgi:hypothetical protein
MYDWYLGGDHNFPADQQAAQQAAALSPAVVIGAQSSRAFLHRAMRYMSIQRVEQFLDLGSGLPTSSNTHQVAREANPDARVAYVDADPTAAAYARDILTGDTLATVTQADIRDVAAVLTAPGVAGLLDFTQPIGILAIAVLHFIPNTDNPAGLIAGYRDACPAGSYLALSHGAATSITPEQQHEGQAIYGRTGSKLTLRSKEEITELLPGYHILPPGVVLLDQWRPDQLVSDSLAEHANGYAALGVLEP